MGNNNEWMRTYRTLIALGVCVVLLGLAVHNMRTDTLDYEQHPVAVVVGTVAVPFIATLGVFWWLGLNKNKPHDRV